MAKKVASFKMSKLLILILILVASFGVWGFLRYGESSVKLEQGNQLLKEGHSSEAIMVFTEAHNLFPLRLDVNESLKGAQLVRQSEGEFSKIAEVDAEIENAELQNIPAVETLPAEQKLRPDELLVPILMYHHIRINPKPGNAVWSSLNVAPNQLETQFQYLAENNFHPITLEELYNALQSKSALPIKPVVLSFDDGYKNFYENAFPLLKKYNFKATEFIITDVASLPAYLSWGQISEMDKSGLVEFGAHTRHHPNLPSLSNRAIVDEIKGSKQDLELHLKRSVHFFAYPYGNYNDFIIKAVKDAGYQAAVSVVYGSVQSNDKLYLMPRLMVDGRFNLGDFSNRLPK